MKPMDKPTDLNRPTDTGDLDDGFYEEPPRLGRKDILAVAAALVLLVLIGVTGYYWMTPGKSVADLLAYTQPAEAETAEADSPVPLEIQEHWASTLDDQAAPPVAAAGVTNAQPVAEDGGIAMYIEDEPLAGLHDHDMRCPYCGMFSEKSASHVIAAWSDGSRTHHDSWDCAFYYGQGEGLELVDAEVSAFGSPVDNPQWLDAAGATFLYDTKPVTGSMPPYVAAFATRAAAEAAQHELSGEIADFVGLQARWE